MTKYVYVTYNPLHEKVVCVHDKEDMACRKCIAANKLLSKSAYFLHSFKHKIITNKK